MMQNNEPMQPFYEYLKNRRQSLLTELDQIERLLGTSPRTAEIRKRSSQATYAVAGSTIVGVVRYDPE